MDDQSHWIVSRKKEFTGCIVEECANKFSFDLEIKQGTAVTDIMRVM